MAEIFPLIYFTHAKLKPNQNLTASIELADSEDQDEFGGNSNGVKRTSFDSESKKKKLKLNIKDVNMNYEAFEDDEQPFLIGLLDKNTNEISDICKSPYFIVKPECYVSKSNESSTFSNVASQASTYSEKLNSLTAAFGSSKKRKAMQTKLKNKIDSETLESALSAAVEETRVNNLTKRNLSDIDEDDDDDEKSSEAKKVDEKTLSEQFSILPEPNKNATSAYEVYSLNQLFGMTNSEIDHFTAELSTKFATATSESIKKWTDMNIYSKYVIEHLLIYLNSKFNHQYALAKCKLLAYMNYLMVIYNLKPNQMQSKTAMKTSEIPSNVIDRLFDSYTVSAPGARSKSNRSMPRRLKDKLICHICILALFIDDFETNLDVFQKDLKLPMQRIVEFCQALGCHVKSKVNTLGDKKIVCKMAYLKLPLNDTTKYEAKKRSKRN